MAKNLTERHQQQNPESPSLNLQDGCPTFVTYKLPEEDANAKQLGFDFERSSHLAVVGLIYSGPISHFWYRVLESIVTLKHRWLNVVCKMFLDAVLFSPIAVGGYFSLRSALEGKDLDGILFKLQLKWMDAVTASWTFWPAANIINFSIVPVPFRVLYNNVLSFGWNAFMSNLNNQRLEEISTARLEDPAAFEVEDMPLARSERTSGVRHISPAVQKAKNIKCVCPHCRMIRA